MNEGETWTVGVTRAPSEPVTLDETIKAVEQLMQSLPACWHYDLIRLSQSEQDVIYACVRCFEKFIAPISFFGGEPPMRLSTDPFLSKSLPWEKSE